MCTVCRVVCCCVAGGKNLDVIKNARYNNKKIKNHSLVLAKHRTAP